MTFNLTLAQKGLILVCVPLLFEIVFVTVLYSALGKAETVARRESQSRAVIGEAHGLAHTLYEAGFVEVKWRFAWKFEKDRSMLTAFDAIMNGIPRHFQKLKQLTSGNPRQEAHVERISKPLEKVVELLTSFRENVQADNSLPIDRAVWAKQLAASTNVLLTEVRSLATDEEQVEDTYAKETEQSNALVKMVLIAGVLFNVLLAIFLAVFFSRTITGRLSILTDNAALLAMRKPLHKPVEGNDEVSKLDRVFHQMADALREAEQRKQEYVAMLGHDLRTPLAAVRGTLALITRGTYGELNEKGKSRVLTAEKSVVNLIGLLNELLEIEKIEAGMMQLQLEEVSLASVVEPIVAALATVAEQHQVSIVPPSRDIKLMADKIKLERLLSNLISNAIKFSPPGGRVTVAASSSQGWSEVRVEDQGRGIPKEAIATIFDRFRQVERSDETEHGGSGLGLAICKAIVEAHQGQIGVESTVGKGSTFWFRLPHKRLQPGSSGR